MKKSYIIILAILLVGFGSCRKDTTELLNPDAPSQLLYDNYSGQFQTIWNGINNAYIFWSVDPMDWDKVYEENLPVFQEFDSLEYVPMDQFEAAWVKVVGNLIDHHMAVRIWNLRPEPEAQSDMITIRPGSLEAETRDYYHLSTHFGDSFHDGILSNLLRMQQQGRVTDLDYATVTLPDMGDFSIIYALVEGCAYLHMSNFAISGFVDVEPDYESSMGIASRIYWEWRAATEAPTTKGIILDNRCNKGGYANDLNYVISPFINETIVIGDTRTKDGLDRFDYTQWTPAEVNPVKNNPNDLSHKPYVVLADVNSVSMGEISTYAVKSLPQGWFVGERTFGATGPLNGMFPMFYAGTFGSPYGSHYVYTSSNMFRFSDGCIAEGIGMIPNEEVLFNAHADEFWAGTLDNQLEKAIQHIGQAQ